MADKALTGGSTGVAAVLAAVGDAVTWLDAHRRGGDEAEVTMRILKVSEEVGEAAQAWLGATGQNPRKGITHTRADVAAELADVVVAALVAMASLGIDPATALVDKARAVSARITTAEVPTRAAHTADRREAA